MLRTLWNRILNRRRWEREMAEEMETHIEERTAHLIGQGVAPDAARRQARIEFGGVEVHKELCREMSPLVRFFDELRRNMTYASRSLVKSPGFTAVAVLSLALGIGANLAIFNLVERLLLTTLAVRDPQTLYQTGSYLPNGQFRNWASYVNYDAARKRNTDLFEGILAWSQWTMEVDVEGHQEKQLVSFVSGNYFPMLGVQAQFGRTFTEEDDGPGPSNLAIIGYRSWEKHFGRSPDVLNKSIKVQNTTFQIVGVAPPGFYGTVPGDPPDVILTLHGNLNFNPNAIKAEGMMWLKTMVRLKPDVPLEAARTVYRERALEVGKAMRTKLGRIDQPQPPTFVPAAGGYSEVRNEFSKAILVLMALVGVVLLIACANLSTLLFVRGAGRAGEMSLRLALGASRGQLVRQWITEYLLIAAAGGVGGLFVARWAVDALLYFLREDSRQYLKFQATPTMLLAAIGLTLFTTLLFGLLPALRSSQATPGAALKESQRSILGRKRWLGRGVLAFQIAASLALVTGAALFVRTLTKLNSDSGNTARSEIVYAHVRFPRGTQGPDGFLDDITDRLRQSAVFAAVGCGRLPLSGGGSWSWTTVPGYVAKPADDNIVYHAWAAPGYFRATGIELIAGRDFEEKDRVVPNQVIIVSESFAKHYFEGRNPIGERVRVTHDGRYVEIIGVVRDVKYSGLRGDLSDVAYTPSPRSWAGTIIARPASAGQQAAALREIQSAVRAASKTALIETGTLEEVIQLALRRDRLVAQLSAVLGLLGLLLAAIGLYGVMAHEVISRTREIGIRMALGAKPWTIVGNMLREAALVTGLGVLVGFPVSVFSARFVESLLYGVTPSDPIAFIAAATILAAAALLAAFWPARRAALLNPVESLRSE
jgi:macrolide transport system ATP-binding/permease protein